MRRFAALLLLVVATVANAQGIQPLADINTTVVVQSPALQVGSRWIMQMCSPCGTWATDGTDGGTVPIGPAALSKPVLFNGVAYFLVATDTGSGLELSQ